MEKEEWRERSRETQRQTKRSGEGKTKIKGEPASRRRREKKSKAIETRAKQKFRPAHGEAEKQMTASRKAPRKKCRLFDHQAERSQE